MQGEYQPLFECATFNSEYDHYWHDYTAAVVGASSADDTVAYMKSSVGAEGYGDKNEAPNFFCGFTNDVATITFGGEDGRTITFTKTDGTTVTHTYAFVKDADATGKYGDYDMKMSGYLYQAQEETEDEFQYLLMFPDTPETTFHLEFRYGGTEADVLNLLAGPYAYWVGSAIQTSALTEENEDTLQKVISLFVVENLASMQNEETNDQRAALVGTWDCDFSAFPDYADAEMYIVLSADGTGKTYADFTGSGDPSLTAEYTFFAYDSDSDDGKDGGTYISLNEAAETVTPGEYEIKDINGKTALVFTSNEGEITYYLREEESSEGGSSGSSGGGSSRSSARAITVAAVENGSVSVSTDKARSGEKVTITVNPDAGYKVADVKVVDENGKAVSVTDNGDGTYTYIMPATAVTVMPTFVPEDQTEPDSASGPFVDVHADAYYSSVVDWAVDKGVTNGVDDTHFAPDASCTRAQMVTFLWRACGSPAISDGENPFEDVTADAYYYDAVLWAVEKGITQGTDDTHFSPDATVDRAQSVTFLYRACGEKTDGTNPFDDVSEGAYYYDAVLWAVSSGVTIGTSDTAFSPDGDCTRAQIVTFLYRAMGLS